MMRITVGCSPSDVDRKQHVYYLKWFRYYYDFCLKYSLEGTNPATCVSFREKLRSKGQADDLVCQADKAVELYIQLAGNLPARETKSKQTVTGEVSCQETLKKGLSPDQICKADERLTQEGLAQPDRPGKVSRLHPISVRDKKASPTATTGADWTELYDDLSSAVQVRHYSLKTLRSYRSWIRQFQTFVKSKEASLIVVDDVKAFLTWLAVERHVSASSQNLAFNSLLFFFRNVLGKEFGTIEGVVRAKKRPYIPVVLDRAEIDGIVAELTHPYSLIVQLLYGCGLRLFECLQLRIQCFNFSAGVLTLHDGKGKKDRTVPIPEILVPELKKQMIRVGEQHQQDLEADYDGVFLFNALELKS